jgi:acetyltransferase-like isoleucine patch superfamily enzyme
MRGFIYFKRWRVHIKANSNIIGARYINIGPQFGAGQHFWIAAIDSYYGGKYNPLITIGSNVSFSDFCHVAAINKIDIGNNVLIGSRVHITDHSHGKYITDVPADPPNSAPIFRRLFSSGSVKIGNNVWIADGVVILPNVSIGDGAVIGANSVVSRNIPENSIAVGSPAKVIKHYKNGCWSTLDFSKNNTSMTT